MADFSIIAQAPEIRQIVQDGLLERAFHDALFPRLLFRGEAFPTIFPGNVGDRLQFTGRGLMKKRMKPLRPGQDPQPSTFGYEQWEATLLPYGDSLDTHMPTSMVAIANLFLSNGHALGLGAGQSLNGLSRNKMFNAAESGWTVADGAQSGTSLRVKRLNGFTRARRPDLSGASPVAFQTVSGSNPLKIRLFDNGAEAANTVVSFTADDPGDEVGPGVLTLGTAATSVLDRAYVAALDATTIVRVGGGNKTDDITASTDVVKLADIRTAIANFWLDNVPEHEDGRFHCHLDPVSMTQIFADAEWQRLLTALPDHYTYRQFALGELLGTVFFRNSENPLASTVDGGSTASFSADDNFAGELFSNGNASTGVPIHRMLFTGQECLTEYYSDMSALITEAGVQGKVGEFSITNNGIEVMADRVRVIIRAPQDRLQQEVATSWHFIGDWVVRTDAATGSASRYKRVQIIQHGQ